MLATGEISNNISLNDSKLSLLFACHRQNKYLPSFYYAAVQTERYTQQCNRNLCTGSWELTCHYFVSFLFKNTESWRSCSFFHSAIFNSAFCFNVHIFCQVIITIKLVNVYYLHWHTCFLLLCCVLEALKKMTYLISSKKRRGILLLPWLVVL